jgi:hypothetical protein
VGGEDFAAAVDEKGAGSAGADVDAEKHEDSECCCKRKCRRRLRIPVAKLGCGNAVVRFAQGKIGFCLAFCANCGRICRIFAYILPRNASLLDRQTWNSFRGSREDGAVDDLA